MPGLRGSRAGIAIAGIFLLFAAAAFAWVYLGATAGMGGTGQSAFVLLLFMLPWAFLVPEAWITPPVGIACILLNALLLYMLFGGLRLSRRR